MSHCRQRNDDWAFSVEGRIEYFGKDMHAADSVYHRSCDINFRTNRNIPALDQNSCTVKKTRKVHGNQYRKSKLIKHYGESIFIAESKGLHEIVTFREKTSSILRNYFSKHKMDKESQKIAIIETAGKLIKSDIKSMIPPFN